MGGRENHSRRADPALCAAALQKSFLQDMQGFMRSESFDRNHAGPLRLEYRHEATIYERAIHQHSTRTTLAFSATFLRAGQMQLVPQHVEEALHRIGMSRSEEHTSELQS